MKITIISFLFLVVTVFISDAQSAFSLYSRPGTEWLESITEEDVPRGAKMQDISFPEQGYQILGYISKRILTEGQIARFCSNDEEPFLFLAGKVSYINNRLCITGVRYEETSKGTTETYGSFYLWNKPDYSMEYNPKRAGELNIEPIQVYYYKGYYLDCPTFVSFEDTPFIIIDGKTGSRSYDFFYAPLNPSVLNNINYSDIISLLLSTNNNARLVSGMAEFSGEVSPSLTERGTIVFEQRFGKWTGFDDTYNEVEISKDGQGLTMILSGRNDASRINKETIHVSDASLIPQDSLWDVEMFYNNMSSYECEFRNGSIFSGDAIIRTTSLGDGKRIEISLTDGKLVYPNGDYFIGNLNQFSNGFPFDGTTYFNDGSIEKGDWIKKYSLTASQITSLQSANNPTEARDKAIKYNHDNNYIEYISKSKSFGSWIEYFNPVVGYEETKAISSMAYNKKNAFYTLKNMDDKVELAIKVNEDGYHTVEIIYYDESPKYQNEISWYSNHMVEQVRTYSLPSRLLYRVCNFYSDGVLRSAYEYREIDGDRVMLRMSKESHPSFQGSYTSKLYDLDGNYERSIEWNIGQHHSIFGDTITNKVSLEPLSLDSFELMQ